MPSKSAVIIPAAGAGLRLGADRPKQYLALGDRPVLARGVGAALAAAGVESVMIGVHGDYKKIAAEFMGEFFPGAPVTIMEGGAERQETVRLCLAALGSSVEIVAIHDAARPFATPELFERTIEAARRKGAATAAIRPADTIKIDNPGGWRENLDRDRLWQVQTPQAFNRRTIIEAHAEAARLGLTVTDDTALAERMGIEVEMIGGSALNFKITTADDLALARAMVEAGMFRPSDTRVAPGE